jgi:hypothetical protein
LTLSNKVEKLLPRIKNTNNLLRTLVFINKLTPFQDQYKNITASGKKWHQLITEKLLYSSFSSNPKNETGLAKFMSLLNLDLLNAARLSETLNTVSDADKIYNLYKAASENLDNIRSENNPPILRAVEDSLKNNLLASQDRVKLNKKNPLEDSINYMNLFKYSTNKDDEVNTSKINQIFIGLRFLKQATGVSLNPLFKKMSEVFEKDLQVAKPIRLAISQEAWRILLASPKYKSEEERLNEYNTLHMNHSKILLNTSQLSSLLSRSQGFDKF